MMNQEKFNSLSSELTTEQCVYFNMLSVEALVDILIKKGICTRDDLISSLNDVKKRQDAYVLSMIDENTKKES